MILIGENLNVISQTLGPALRERNAEPIQEMAKAETEAGVDLIDLNIGPARKGGDELMDWVVNTVQTVTDKMLSPDSTGLFKWFVHLEESPLPVFEPSHIGNIVQDGPLCNECFPEGLFGVAQITFTLLQFLYLTSQLCEFKD